MSIIRTRKRGNTYSYSFEAGKTLLGRRKVVEKGGFKTEKEAMTAGMDAYISWQHGDIGITSERITLGEFIEEFLEARKDEFRGSTVGVYRGIARNHVNPILGGYPVQDITPLMVNKWIRHLAGKGLSKNTIGLAKKFLHSVMQYAVFPGQLISGNPVIRIKLPKSVPDNVKPHKAYTPEEFGEILSGVERFTPVYTAALIQFCCGLRIGEAIGLTWDRLDLAMGTLTVDRQMGRTLRLQPPKTESSIRTIYIPAGLLAYLKQLNTRQKENRLKAGAEYLTTFIGTDGTITYNGGDNASFVLVNGEGRIATGAPLMRRYRELGVRSHSLRHSHATLLFAAGASLADIAERLGHANISTTMDIYTHNTEGQKEKTVKIFDSLFEVCRQIADK